MVNRRYTGFDGNTPGQRAGLEKFVDLTVKRFDGGAWNNGTWGPRLMRNPGPPKPSVHGTGRAADMSWRGDGRRGYGDYRKALQVAELWIANAELFMIEAIHDYYPEPWGRGWQCDRSAWLVYKEQKIGSAPGGDWFHLEIAPAHADDPAYYEQAFASLDGALAPAPIPGPAPTTPAGVPQPGLVVPSGDPELSLAYKDTAREDVKALQEILINRGWADFTKADGKYGNNTTNAVQKMQTAFGFSGQSLDGKYGPRTANKLTEWLTAGE